MIDFSGYTREAIQKEMLSKVDRGIDTREGSIVQTALGPAAWYLEGLYMVMGQMQDNAYADTAAGECLDRICAAHNIKRKPATAAVRKGMFNTEAPLGSAFRTIDGAASLVFYSGRLISHEGNMYVHELTCGMPGEAGNAYTGKILPVSSIAGLSSAAIGETITPGTDEEADVTLRERLLRKIRLPSTSGNRYDYYNWAMECEGVGAAKVFPLAGGPGTVKVVVADAGMSAAPEALIRAVKGHIEGLRPIGADVAVSSAVERAVNVSARVYLEGGASLGAAQNAFQTALKEYLQGNAFALTYVSLAHIGSLLLGTAGVADYGRLQLNGAGDNVRLGQEEIAVAGAVALEVAV